MATLDNLVRMGGGKLPSIAVALMRDMILNCTREASGRRWSADVQALFAVVRVRDAAACDLLTGMLGLAHHSTIRRYLRTNSFDIKYGLHIENMQAVKRFYDKVMSTKPHLRGRVPVSLARDETAIDGGLDWCTRTCSVFGFCGEETGAGLHHCWSPPVPFRGDSDDAYSRLCELLSSHRVGRRECTCVRVSIPVRALVCL